MLQVLGPSAGGIRRHVACLADGLRGRGWSVRTAGPAGVLDGIGHLDAVVDVASSLRPAAVVRARRQLAEQARGVDVVHAHGLKAGWLATMVRDRPPVVVSVHNLVLDEAAGRSAPALRFLEGRLVRRADRTIAVSEQIAARFAGLPGADRVVTIPPLSPPPEPSRTRADVRAGLGLAEGERLVVSVGRFHPQKDLPTLVRAFGLLRQGRADVRLALVGSGPAEAEVRELVTRLGLDDAVVLPGYSANGADELAAADVVALSSRWEGTPVVVAEALRLQQPVVATAVGGVPTLVEDGVTGRLVLPGDPEAFATALAEVLADPDGAAALGRAGRARVEETLGTDALLARIEDVYRAVLGAT